MNLVFLSLCIPLRMGNGQDRRHLTYEYPFRTCPMVFEKGFTNVETACPPHMPPTQTSPSPGSKDTVQKLHQFVMSFLTDQESDEIETWQ